MMVPMMGIVSLIAGIYSLYLFYVGLPVLMRSPRKNALVYTMVVVVLSILVNLLLTRMNIAMMGQTNILPR